MQGCTDPYQAILKEAFERNIPFKVLWEVTYRCNLHCIHCYRVEEPRSELSTSEAKALIDDLAAAGCLYITFSGGEPLTREDFIEIAGYARSRGFAIRLFTNGTLISTSVARQLQSLHPISVEVSLYGIRSDTFEKISQVDGSFDRVLEGIRLLREAHIKTVLKCPLMTVNFPERKGIEQLAHSLGADVSFDNKMSPKNNGEKEPLAFRITTEQMEIFLQEEKWFPPNEKDDLPPCNAGKTIGTISPYGDIFPCVQLRLPAGNVREEPFRRIWYESQIFQNLRSIKGRDVKDCVNCSYSDYCVRCPGLAHLETGDMCGKSPLACYEAKVRASLRGKNVPSHTRGFNEKEAVRETKSHL